MNEFEVFRALDVGRLSPFQLLDFHALEKKRGSILSPGETRIVFKCGSLANFYDFPAGPGFEDSERRKVYFESVWRQLERELGERAHIVCFQPDFVRDFDQAVSAALEAKKLDFTYKGPKTKSLLDQAREDDPPAADLKVVG